MIVVATIVVPSRLSLTILIAALSWFSTARLVRGEALRIRRLEYVDAARVAGTRRIRMIVRHVLPNAIGVIVVSTTFQVADAILLLASLDFLGLGIPPPASSWGGMLTSGLEYIYNGYWWLIAPAGAIIVITVTAVNFIGDGLREGAGRVRVRESVMVPGAANGGRRRPARQGLVCAASYGVSDLRTEIPHPACER